jgi:GT2 family glycosyltransferase
LTDPSVSVVLCVRNAAKTIEPQLEALAAQTYAAPWELLVVDNGCTDTTIDIVHAWESRIGTVRIIDARDLAGLAHARNVGVAAALAPLVAFCDGDDVVDARWLAALVEATGKFDLVGGRLEVDELNSERAIYWRGPRPADTVLPHAAGFVRYAVGANFALSRETYLAVGGCDERFVICSDDVDLSWRVQRAGGTIGFAPGAVVHYRLREGLRDAARQQWRYGYAETMLREKFGAEFRWPGWRQVLLGWVYLATRLDHLVRNSTLRGRYICVAAYRGGRLWGSLRNGVLWL